MSDNSFDRAPTVWQHSLASVQEEQSFGMGQMSDMGHLYGIAAKKDGGAKKRNKDTFNEGKKYWFDHIKAAICPEHIWPLQCSGVVSSPRSGKTRVLHRLVPLINMQKLHF